MTGAPGRALRYAARLAAAAAVSWGLIAALSREAPRFSAAAPTPAGTPERVVIDKSSNTLFLYRYGSLRARFPVGTGRSPRFTPEGTFTIGEKLVKGRGPRLAPPFGPRWIGLEVPGFPRASEFGIHGTNEPGSIGGHVSAGCIRMRNDDVKRLFDAVRVGTPVSIRR